jgi:hypothetical protein
MLPEFFHSPALSGGFHMSRHVSESLQAAAVIITAFGNVDDEQDRERRVLYMQSLISPFLQMMPADDISQQ